MWSMSDVRHPLDGELVGRHDELQRLARILVQAGTGRGSLVILSGEAGIGKTRIVQEFVSRIPEAEARVLVSRCCDREGAPPYWDWIQLIRAYAQHADPESLRSALGARAAVIAEIVEDVHGWCSGLEAVAPLPPQQARFRLFDAVASFFNIVASARPLVLFFDDVQAMDGASLLMLEFVAREAREHRILLVVTLRDTEIPADHPLRDVVAELSRLEHFEQLEIQGLGVAEVERLIRQVGGVTAPGSVVDRVRRETAGNPLFVCEMVRALASDDRALLAGELPWRPTVPQKIAHLIERRCRGLSAECCELLKLAAVFGLSFSDAMLQRVSALDSGSILNAMDEAVAGGIVQALPNMPGWYAFSHGLMRETLYGRLPTVERVRLHHRIGVSLEEVYAEEATREHVPELAHHFSEAARGGAAAKAITYSRQAGDRAIRLFAHEEAAVHYRRALQLLELDGAGAEEARCEVLMALGEALDRAGEVASAREALLRAAECARQLGLTGHVARVALAYALGRRYFELTKLDCEGIRLLEDALAIVSDPPLRARLLCRLAELHVQADPEHARDMLPGAVECAQGCDDDQCLLDVMLAWHYVSWEPDNILQRRAVAEQAVRVASRLEDRDAQMVARASLLADLLELGDLHTFDVELAEHERLSAQNRQPFWKYVVSMLRAMRATMTGPLDAAEPLVERALVLGQGPARVDALMTYGAQLATLRWGQGRFAEIEELFDAMATEYPMMRVLEWSRPNMLNQIGRRGEAACELERIAASDFRDLPRNNMWLASMALVAEACADLEDAARAETLYEMLLPCADLMVTTTLGTTCWGPAARTLGRLATTLSRWDAAEEHFRRARQLCLQAGSSPYLALTDHDYATMLLRRGRGRDADDAELLLRRAVSDAERFGWHRLVGRIREKLTEVPDGAMPEEFDRAPKVSVDAVSMRPASVRIAACEWLFCREGEYWTLGEVRSPVRVRDMVGLKHLALLLGHPDQPFTAGEMSTQQNGGYVHQADTGPALDSRATSEYRRRLRELREELDDAEACHDLGRVANAQAEIGAIQEQLARGIGLGMRRRRAGSATERARLNVTRTIRAAIRRIGKHAPNVERYLSSTIRTGRCCSYEPTPMCAIVWIFERDDAPRSSITAA
jgi:tetratricopeptide (TPR) repeat protein